MSSRGDPPRLRSMKGELPEQLAAALDADLSDFPEPEQLAELTRRIGPLLGSATLAAGIPIAMAPKAPLTASATFKVLALKWTHTVIVPVVIGAASGTAVWEAGQMVVDDGERTGRIARFTEPTAVPREPTPFQTNRVSTIEPAPVDRPADREDVSPAPRTAVPVPTPSLRNSSSRTMAAPVDYAVEDVERVSEIELIDRAQRALVQNPAEARKWADEHERRFPEGTFTQERETVAIEAMAREGRVEQARARARQFRSRFPGSTYLPRIESVLQRPGDRPSPQE